VSTHSFFWQTVRDSPEKGVYLHGITENSSKERLTLKRQRQILDAAIRVFSRKGFNGATTREIALEAGVAEGTIFRYFKTKKDILLGLVGPYVVDSLAEIMDDVSGEDDEVVLKTILRNRFNLIRKNIDLARLLFSEAQFHPEIKEYLADNVIMKVAGIIEAFIEKRIKKGSYKDIDPSIAARILAGMGSIFFFWNEFLFSNRSPRFDEEKVVDHVVDIFLNGIRVIDRRREGTGDDEF